MKVLISAYACEPGRGSEPGSGWEWSRAAALNHEVWLLTRENNAPAIEEALAKEPDLRLHPVYLDVPQRARFWKRGGRGVHLYYLLWQVLARRVARRLHVEVGFDVAHHITFAVDWMPAGVVGIPGLPAVWGPVGGATGTPWNLWRWLGWRGILSEALREATTRPMRRLFGDRAARRAALIVAQNHDVGRRFANHGPLVVEPHVALDVGELSESFNRALGTPQHARCIAVFVGRLVPWKGLRLAIAALAEPTATGWDLHVYGSGPERKPAEKLANRSGVAERVVFHGQRDRSVVLDAMATSDAFLFPSMHDSAPWAVGEAVAARVPVVCLDRGGPPILTADAGTAVSAEGRATPARLAASLATARSRGTGSDAWAASRLPALLSGWYSSTQRSKSDVYEEFQRLPRRAPADRAVHERGIGRVVHYYPRAMVGDGGLTATVWGWASAIRASGTNVAVLYDGELLGESALADAAVAAIPIAHRGVGRFSRPLQFQSYLQRGDILVLHSAYLRHNLTAARVAAQSRIPYIAMPHGAYEPQSRARRRLRKRAWEVLERGYLERALAVHLSHRPEAAGVHAVAPHARTIVAPAGVKPHKAKCGGLGREQRLAWFGRYDIQHKGIDLLLQALALIAPHERPHMVLHGRDSAQTREEVEEIAASLGLEQTVEVRGPITGEDKDRFLETASAWVHPSRWESHSIALLEALAVGLPCLTTSTVAIAPLLQEHGAAVVVDPTPESLADGILRVLANATELRVRVRAFVEAELAWPVVAEQFMTQASDLMAQKREETVE